MKQQSDPNGAPCLNVYANIHILCNNFWGVSRPPLLSTNIRKPPSPLCDYVIYKWCAKSNIMSITSLFCPHGIIYLITLDIKKNI